MARVIYDDIAPNVVNPQRWTSSTETRQRCHAVSNKRKQEMPANGCRDPVTMMSKRRKTSHYKSLVGKERRCREELHVTSSTDPQGSLFRTSGAENCSAADCGSTPAGGRFLQKRKRGSDGNDDGLELLSPNNEPLGQLGAKRPRFGGFGISKICSRPKPHSLRSNGRRKTRTTPTIPSPAQHRWATTDLVLSTATVVAEQASDRETYTAFHQQSLPSAARCDAVQQIDVRQDEVAGTCNSFPAPDCHRHRSLAVQTQELYSRVMSVVNKGKKALSKAKEEPRYCLRPRPTGVKKSPRPIKTRDRFIDSPHRSPVRKAAEKLARSFGLDAEYFDGVDGGIR